LEFLVERNVSGNLERYFVNGPSYIDERVLMRDATGFAGPSGPAALERYDLLKELYTVAGLADENGELVEVYDYDAYGKVRVYTAETVACGVNSDADGDCGKDKFASGVLFTLCAPCAPCAPCALCG
jgi:hypothetical protein